MPTVADVLRRYGEDYLERFGATMPAEHKKVLRAITACRTGELGTVLYVCESCGTTHAMGRSCGNRHCPTCQQDKTKAWLETPNRPPAAVSLLPANLHRPGRAARIWCAVTSGSPTPRSSRRPAPRSRPWRANPKYVGSSRLRLLRRAAHLGPHAGVSSPRPLRRARAEASAKMGRTMAAVTRRLLPARESPIGPLPRQVPGRPGSRRLAGASRSGGVAARLGGPFARPSATAEPR